MERRAGRAQWAPTSLWLDHRGAENARPGHTWTLWGGRRALAAQRIATRLWRVLRLNTAFVFLIISAMGICVSQCRRRGLPVRVQHRRFL
eukprot:199521-Rhodomonas_salina.2